VMVEIGLVEVGLVEIILAGKGLVRVRVVEKNLPT
jgi:hypothetical protein